MKEIQYTTLFKIEKIISKFSLVKAEPVVVSYSGGKDSLFLCIALLQLGYDVMPVTVDVGFNSDWSLAKKNLSSIDLPFTLINAENSTNLFPNMKNQLDDYLRLCNLEGVSNTICTYCYNLKILMLDSWAKHNHIPGIAFGHHATDSLASFLKSYFMYIDRWHNHNEHFINSEFASFISTYSSQFNTDINTFVNGELYKNIEFEFRRKHAGTDEPVIQNLLDEKTTIYRPMFEVFEQEIEEYFNNTSIAFNQSECFLTGKRKPEILTPREMVQYYILRNANIDICHCLLKLLYESFDENGFLLYNVRRHRDDILGTQYKNNHGYQKL